MCYKLKAALDVLVGNFGCPYVTVGEASIIEDLKSEKYVEMWIDFANKAKNLQILDLTMKIDVSELLCELIYPDVSVWKAVLEPSGEDSNLIVKKLLRSLVSTGMLEITKCSGKMKSLFSTEPKEGGSTIFGGVDGM